MGVCTSYEQGNVATGKLNQDISSARAFVS